MSDMSVSGRLRADAYEAEVMDYSGLSAKFDAYANEVEALEDRVKLAESDLPDKLRGLPLVIALYDRIKELENTLHKREGR